jgi:dihydroorotate dehydrogenase electron transfer subunit
MANGCSAAPLPGMVLSARQQVARVVAQVALARDTWRLRLHCPDIARQAVPGQFFMIRQPGVINPLLGRPFALYDTWLDEAGEPAGIDVVYLVVGKMTRLMSGWDQGEPVEIWGPLGNGFPPLDCDHLILVAGGIGYTPFLAVAREALGKRRYSQAVHRQNSSSNGMPSTAEETARAPSPIAPAKIDFCYGVRSVEYLADRSDFQALGIEPHIATDDGSFGHRGFVTELLAGILERKSAATAGRTAIYCCGPEPMMHGTAELAAKHGVSCWLSLETPMACGFGACFSCVTRVKLPEGGWDYRRVCVEGPIFRSAELAW